MYKVKYSKQVIKFLQKQDISIKTKVLDFFDNIKVDASFKNYDVKKLKGLGNTYRLIISKFRIIFSVNSEKLLIKAIKADNRADVYK